MTRSLLFFSGFTKPSWHLRQNQEGGKRHPLANQWLGLYTFTASAWVRFLVGKLRCHKLPGKAKKKRVTQICPVGLCTDATHSQFGTWFLFCIGNILDEVVKSTNFINFNPEYSTLCRKKWEAHAYSCWIPQVGLWSWRKTLEWLSCQLNYFFMECHFSLKEQLIDMLTLLCLGHFYKMSNMSLTLQAKQLTVFVAKDKISLASEIWKCGKFVSILSTEIINTESKIVIDKRFIPA